MTENNYVEINKGHLTGFVGPDATQLYRAIQLRAFIKLYRETGMKPTRHIGIKDMLKIAKEFSGKDYVGKKDYEQAENDLTVWIEAMKSAIPMVKRS